MKLENVRCRRHQEEPDFLGTFSVDRGLVAPDWGF